MTVPYAVPPPSHEPSLNACTDAVAPGVPLSEAARRLGVSRDAIRQRIRRGSIPAIKLDGVWYVSLNGEADASSVNGRTDAQGTHPGSSGSTRSGTDGDTSPGTAYVPEVDRLHTDLEHVREMLAEVQKQRDELAARLADAHEIIKSDAVERAELRRLLGHAQQQLVALLPSPGEAPGISERASLPAAPQTPVSPSPDMTLSRHHGTWWRMLLRRLVG